MAHGDAETLPLDEPDDREAISTAFEACTPYGHTLWEGRRFLGYFEAGDGRRWRPVPATASASTRGAPPC
jgi:hypothetical protein